MPYIMVYICFCSITNAVEVSVSNCICIERTISRFFFYFCHSVNQVLLIILLMSLASFLFFIISVQQEFVY